MDNPPIVVSNSSPLIALARIKALDLLPSLYSQILIPLAVHQEVVALEQGREGSEVIASAPWIQVCPVQDSLAVGLLREQLDLGESEAIILALETPAQLLLIDEVRGRRIAQSRGLIHTGTIGIITVAKRRKLIPSGTVLLDQLQNAGFRMNAVLYHQAKALMQE